MIPRHPDAAVLFMQDTDGRVYVCRILKPHVDWDFVGNTAGVQHILNVRAADVDATVFETYEDFMEYFTMGGDDEAQDRQGRAELPHGQAGLPG